MKDFLLLIDEVIGHPDSALTKICSRFDKQSILHVSSEQQLSKIKTKPIFSDKYLVIFDSFYTLKQTIQSVKFEYMLPVYNIQKREYDEVLSFLNENKVPYSILKNAFGKEEAQNLITKMAKENLTDQMVKQILKRTGFYPKKIMTAVALLDTYGYTEKNIKELLDFSVYVSSFDILVCLLKLPITKKKYTEILSYISTYKAGFRYIREELLTELQLVTTVFFDILHSIPTQKGVREYITDIENLSYYKYHQINDFVDKISMIDLLALKRYLSDADFLSFISLLGGDRL